MVNGTSKEKTSFKLVERSDYKNDLDVPSASYHIFETFKMVFAMWKITMPLLLISVVLLISLTGLITESSFRDAGVWVMCVIVFLMLWLTTIFALRQKMAGNKVGLRDTLYNSMGPLAATLVMFLLAAIQCIPLMLLVIAYASAVETNFLSMPFYAFLFLVFAGLMILISGYLLSGTLMAMTAVTAPGLYPYEALKATNEMMRGQRIKFVIRLIALFIVVGVMWVIVVWPTASLMGQTPFTSIVAMIMGCFSAIFVAVYFYLYYRFLIDGVNSSSKKKKRE